MFLVEIQIIMSTKNKQWNKFISLSPVARDVQPTTAMPPSPSLASSALSAVAVSAARTRAAAVTALSAAKASVTVIGHGIGGKYIPIMARLAKARCWSK